MRPRYVAYEVEKQDNSVLRRNPTVQNAPRFMEKEVRRSFSYDYDYVDHKGAYDYVSGRSH